MGSYYYTEQDRLLADCVAMELRDRLEYDAKAKRGRRWKLDGEAKTWAELFWWFVEPENANFDAPEYKGREELFARYPAAAQKINNTIPFQGFLALLRIRLEHWQGDQVPF